MKNKALILMPISVLGLLSCTPDTKPKTMSYSETLTYVNKHYSKEVKTPEGHIIFTTDGEADSNNILTALGAINLPTTPGGSGENDIDSTTIKKFIDNSETLEPTYTDLPLMYLNPDNFTYYNYSTYSFKLTYQKELVITFSNSEDYQNIRYYNQNLRLTRFEINSNETSKVYSSTQTFVY